VRYAGVLAAASPSPRAPGFSTKIGAFGRRPLITTIRSPSKTGVGAVMFELRPSRDSSLPVSWRAGRGWLRVG
jgi:hypothetical protein